MKRDTKSTEEVLVYLVNGPSRTTVYRHFLKWRKVQGIPIRCDEASCVFFSQPLIWNGKPFKPILDHKNGNSSDNWPKNVRFLCPNCDSQLDTRGGANKGRIEKSEGGFAIVSKDGGKNYVLPAEPARLVITGNPAMLAQRRKPPVSR